MIYAILVIALLVGAIALAVYEEASVWNGGISKKTGRAWRLYGTMPLFGVRFYTDDTGNRTEIMLVNSVAKVLFMEAFLFVAVFSGIGALLGLLLTAL